ncbi:uncharacterized protein CBL_06018 [Carabus blaptoides fortunei]
MATIDKVRVIVVGDSGVGKTSLVHLIAHNEPIKSPSWTVGCSVEVKLHEFKEGTPVQKPYFIELWDVGGSSQHRNARSVFYTPTHGIILIHDLTNRKSQENLQKWLSEILNREEKPTLSTSTGKYYSITVDDFDTENFVGSTQIPILVIGTKLDLAEEKFRTYQQMSNTIAQQCGTEELFLDCRQTRYLGAGSTNAVKLSRFFDKVIERRHCARDASPFGDRRKFPTTYLGTANMQNRYYHRD